jgi:hypothetical protein
MSSISSRDGHDGDDDLTVSISYNPLLNKKPNKNETDHQTDEMGTLKRRQKLKENINNTSNEVDISDDDICSTSNSFNENKKKKDKESSSHFSVEKMNKMQKQLEVLTSLVHQALSTKDISHLASAVDLESMQMMLERSTTNEKNRIETKIEKSSNNNRKQQKDLVQLDNQTKLMKNDLNGIKKLHQNFNSSFGDSMKSFVKQLNDKVKSFCVNEINEKIKLDIIVYKYQMDAIKIENELVDLEVVVDDLRESILKHKCNVNIDDVECYALALSQLSKQLLTLKSSFSTVKHQLKITTNNEEKNNESHNR